MKIKLRGRGVWRLAAAGAALSVTAFALAVGGGSANAAFAGKNGKIAFVSNRDGNREIYVMNPDGSAQTKAGTIDGGGNHAHANNLQPDCIGIVCS